MAVTMTTAGGGDAEGGVVEEGAVVAPGPGEVVCCV